MYRDKKEINAVVVNFYYAMCGTGEVQNLHINTKKPSTFIVGNIVSTQNKEVNKYFNRNVFILVDIGG